MNALHLDELLDVPALNTLPPPWEDLERIDETIRQAAAYVQRSPWLLARFLPSLNELARTRKERLLSWTASLESHPIDEIRAFLSSNEQPTPAITEAPEPHEEVSSPAPEEPADEATKSALLAPMPDALQDQLDPSEEQENALPDSPVELAPEPGILTEVPVATALVNERIFPGSLALPVPPAVSQEHIKAFALQFGKRQRFTSDLVRQRDPVLCRRENLVRGILENLGDLPEKMTQTLVVDWKKRLEMVTSPAALLSWSILDDALKVELLTMLIALARAVQDAGGPQQEPRQVFSRLSAYSQTERPGHAHGMARQHKPQHGGWLKDASKVREGLLTWLGDTATPVAAASPAPPLARTQPEPEESSALDELESLLEEDWPWWNDVRNRRAILVGGVPKEPSRLRMAQAFQFADLAWIDGDVRKVTSVTERIQRGSLDLVLIVRNFIGHKAAKKVQFACKNRKVPCVFIERGHGVLAVRRSIERYLAQSA